MFDNFFRISYQVFGNTAKVGYIEISLNNIDWCVTSNPNIEGLDKQDKK